MLAVAAWLGSSLGALAGPAVPTFSQRSAQWSRQALGTDRVDTIGSAGCALTAVTMVTAPYGHSTNPRLLNPRLTPHRGHPEKEPLPSRHAAAAAPGSGPPKGVHLPRPVAP